MAYVFGRPSAFILVVMGLHLQGSEAGDEPECQEVRFNGLVFGAAKLGEKSEITCDGDAEYQGNFHLQCSWADMRCKADRDGKWSMPGGDCDKVYGFTRPDDTIKKWPGPKEGDEDIAYPGVKPEVDREGPSMFEQVAGGVSKGIDTYNQAADTVNSLEDTVDDMQDTAESLGDAAKSGNAGDLLDSAMDATDSASSAVDDAESSVDNAKATAGDVKDLTSADTSASSASKASLTSEESKILEAVSKQPKCGGSNRRAPCKGPYKLPEVFDGDGLQFYWQKAADKAEQKVGKVYKDLKKSKESSPGKDRRLFGWGDVVNGAKAAGSAASAAGSAAADQAAKAGSAAADQAAKVAAKAKATAAEMKAEHDKWVKEEAEKAALKEKLTQQYLQEMLKLGSCKAKPEQKYADQPISKHFGGSSAAGILALFAIAAGLFVLLSLSLVKRGYSFVPRTEVYNEEARIFHMDTLELLGETVDQDP